MIEEIKAFVERNSYLDYLDYADGYEFDGVEHLTFETRDNGDVGEEVYGEEDYKEAVRLQNILLKKFDGISINIDTVDEWILLEIRIKD